MLNMLLVSFATIVKALWPWRGIVEQMLTWQWAIQRSSYAMSMNAHPQVIWDIFWPTHLKLPCCISCEQMSWLWSCTIKHCLCVPKQMCYCLIGVDVVEWLCSGFIVNGDICVGPSMMASEQWSAFVSIENGCRACSACFSRRGCGFKLF